MVGKNLIGIFFCSAAAMADPTSISVDGSRLTVQTATLEAVFDGPRILSIRPLEQSTDFAHPVPAESGVDLIFINGEVVGKDKHQTVVVRKLSDLAACIEVQGDETRRALFVSVDLKNGDLRITPDGLSDRRGLRAVRWTVPMHPEATVILPVVNGLQFNAQQPHPGTDRLRWPVEWNAQLAIARLDGWSMMIHCEDHLARFKALQLIRQGTRTELGFESESPGPLWDNRTAGGIEWRINVYRGDWTVPAMRYREWMEKTYDLAAKRVHRPDWVAKVSLAVCCWTGLNESILDALATAHPPEQTIIHYAFWRTDKYDHYYPDYTPSEEALEFMAKAKRMGFHVMPHFNFFAVDCKHPLYQQLRDFQYRTVDRNVPEGWFWPPDTYDYTRMAYIHPGLGYWRRILIDRVIKACARVDTDFAYLDQTLWTANTDNGVVQGLNTVQGLRQLHEEFAAAAPHLVLAGEGYDEISFQRQSFAFGHIYQGFGELEQKHIEAAHPINSFLWDKHTRLIGYNHPQPGQKGFEMGVEIYERMNAMPTIITNKPEDILNMTPMVRRIFERAKHWNSSTMPSP